MSPRYKRQMKIERFFGMSLAFRHAILFHYIKLRQPNNYWLTKILLRNNKTKNNFGRSNPFHCTTESIDGDTWIQFCSSYFYFLFFHH